MNFIWFLQVFIYNFCRFEFRGCLTSMASATSEGAQGIFFKITFLKSVHSKEKYLPQRRYVYSYHVDFGCCFLSCLFLLLTLRHTCTRAISIVNSEWHTSKQSVSSYTIVSYKSRLRVTDYINPVDFGCCFFSCLFLLLTLRHTCARAVSVVNSEWHTSMQAKQEI